MEEMQVTNEKMHSNMHYGIFFYICDYLLC